MIGNKYENNIRVFLVLLHSVYLFQYPLFQIILQYVEDNMLVNILSFHI